MKAGTAKAAASSRRNPQPATAPDADTANSAPATSQTHARDLYVYGIEPCSDQRLPAQLGATRDRRPSNALHRGNRDDRPHFIGRRRSSSLRGLYRRGIDIPMRGLMDQNLL